MRPLKLIENGNPFYEQICLLLGSAVWTMQLCGSGRFSIAAACHWLIPAIRLGQIKFLYYNDGRPCAFAYWAWVSDETLRRLQEDKVNPLHFSEWNEGRNLWIVDLVAPAGLAMAVARSLQVELAGRANTVFGLRRDREGKIRRLVQVQLSGTNR